MKEAIAKIVTGAHLSEEEMVAVMDQIMSGECTPAQIGSFITALRLKGETVAEITGAARVMRQKATKIVAGSPEEIIVDTCGTGGDSSGTFNVSTASAFIVAGSGLKVAKHGNRSVSSKCGSADVLEALGVNLNMTPERIGSCVQEVGIGFLFAPLLHGAMKHAIGPRREIGIRTVFNILGPLTNPAGANVQVLGVYDPQLTEKLAHVLANLGSKRALVVCGEGNIDELTITGETLVADMEDGRVTTYRLSPADAGLETAALAAIKGGDTVAESAAQLRDVLAGAPGARLDMVLLNAGAALMAAGRAGSIRAGVELARGAIGSGAAMAKLEQLVAFSQQQKDGAQ